MTDLRKAAQQALEVLGYTTDPDHPHYEDQLAAITALRAALEQQAEPVAHAVIVGALFDFMGWLTTRKERLILSSTDNASPAADAIKVFAEMRGLSLDDARVQDWQNYTTPFQQQAEPVALKCGAIIEVFDKDWRMEYLSLPVGKHKLYTQQYIYTAPPQRQWDKPSASFNAWWDSEYDDSANPFEQDSAAYWAWAGWQAAQRQWQGLTDEDVNRESAPIAQQMKLAFHAGMYVAQKILKEKNGG